MFRLPGPRDRTWVTGHTGSGKSYFGFWLLSHQDYDKKPWVLLDSKREALFDKIPRLHDLAPDSDVPKRPGLYRLQYDPDEDDAVDEFLKRVWRKGKTGILVDEGHALPGRGGIDSPFVRALASQGRSLGIPMIVLSQRPSWISKFVRSEADHLITFRLSARDDYKALQEIVPIDLEAATVGLPEYHSIYFCVANRSTHVFPPVPRVETIVERFQRRVPLGFWADLPQAQRRR